MATLNALLIVDHGSRRAEANALLSEIAEMVRARTEAGWVVHYAHMELAPPTIAEAFAQCVDDGAKLVVVHPFMLARGNHVTHDIPRLVAEAAEAHPDVDFRITAPLAPHPSLVDIVLDRVQRAVDE